MEQIQRRTTFLIQGDQQELEKILALFEAETWSDGVTIQVLDVGILSSESPAPTFSPPPPDRTSEALTRWLDHLWSIGFQPAFRGSQSISGIKSIQVAEHPIDIIVKIESVQETEIQIFVQIRPVEGKGYLPEGLIVRLFDEFDHPILEQYTQHQTNLLDVTQGGRFLCHPSDHFSLLLSLGNEQIREDFAG